MLSSSKSSPKVTPWIAWKNAKPTKNAIISPLIQTLVAVIANYFKVVEILVLKVIAFLEVEIVQANFALSMELAGYLGLCSGM